MKKIIGIFTIISLIAVSSIAQQSKGLYIQGSETVLPLSLKFAEVYRKMNPGTEVQVVGGGSGVGIDALIKGKTDIAQASRKIKPGELEKLKAQGRTIKEVEIAYDALAVIVNPANGLDKLTREQLEEIFTGKVSNWQELGGDNIPVIIFSRESSSGTYAFFKEHVLQNNEYAASSMVMPNMDALTLSVSQTPNSIGYIGLAYLNKDVKAVNVSFDGKTFVGPSEKTVFDKTYPIIRSLYYYYDVKEECKVMDFLNFVLSPDGQQIVEEVGYIPILTNNSK